MNRRFTKKRMLDILLAFIWLLSCAPLMGLIALVLRLESRGTVIYKQQRLGLLGKPFTMYKFRKFPANWGQVGPGVTVAGDVRMTTVGWFLERTKLDELPQLWNILRGDMSFVGPRPESLRYADLFKGEFTAVLDYTPGIFGPSQIAFRNESRMYPTDEDPEQFYRRVLFSRKAKVDLEYFSGSNWLSDFIQLVHGVFISLAGIFNWKQLFCRRALLFLFDMTAIAMAYIVAWLLLSESQYGSHFSDNLPVSFWAFPAVLTPTTMLLFGCYRNFVRHIIPNDIVRLAGVVSICSLLAYLHLVWIDSHQMLHLACPQAMILSLVFVILPRILYNKYLHRSANSSGPGIPKHRILIYGTDDFAVNMGALVQNGLPNYELIGFLDDKPSNRGRYLLSKKIIGCRRDLPTIHAVYRFDQVWLSFSPDRVLQKWLTNWCSEHNITPVIFPVIEPFNFIQTRQGSSVTGEIKIHAVS